MSPEGRLPWFLDESTGFPLPLMPLKDAPTVYTKHGKPYHHDPDLHHFFFPRKQFNSHEIGPGGQVVRISRLQNVRRYWHTTAHNSLQPPPLIEDQGEQFRLSLLALTNFIPKKAIDMRGSSPEIVELSDNEYADLQESTKTGFSRSYYSAVGRFFLSAAIKTSGHIIDYEKRDEFLHTKHIHRQKELGNQIIKMVCSHAVEPVNRHYAEARSTGEIPATQPSPFRTVTTFAKHAKPHHFLRESLEVA
jgi:hypothetical protein